MVLRLIAFAIVIIACTYFYIKEDFTLFFLFVFLFIITFSAIISLHKRSIKKIEHMFDAIDNNDLTFQYATSQQSSDDKTINEMINRVIRTLLRVRIDTVKHEKFYEQIIDAVNIGIIVIDDHGFVIRKNNKAMQFLGLSVLTHIKQIRHTNEKLSERLTNPLSDDKFNISYETEQGTIEICVNISKTYLQNKNIFIVTFNDINSDMDNKELDSWIRLTRVMTHEIMNSITPITSICDTLLSKNNYRDEEIKNGLEVISKTGKSLITFVESYRRFTHIPNPEPTLFYLKDFVERMITLARHHIDSENITWQTDIQPENLILYADENLISQVMINLLKNAQHAIFQKQTNENGLISIKASCNEVEAIVIEVSNNGAAIPEEESAHIFIPFFTTKENGSGVGLSVARQIMRLSGGSITLKKASSSAMTTFVLTFP
jgi:Signal transduction histidine kinase involved in nitrogen fixation and metabolism regulation